MTANLFIMVFAILTAVPTFSALIYLVFRHRTLKHSSQHNGVTADTTNYDIAASATGSLINQGLSAARKTAANRVLIVEDDIATSDAMRLILENQGFIIQTTDLAEDALERVKHTEYNAILLDLALPDKTGYEVLQEMREIGVNVPILIVTGTERDPSHGFLEGANDYIVKPFSAEELASRVGSAVRSSFGVFSPKIKLDGILIDLERRTVSIGQLNIKISATEFAFFELIALQGVENTTIQNMTRHIFEDHQSRQTFDAVKATMSSINSRLNESPYNKRFVVDGQSIQLVDLN